MLATWQRQARLVDVAGFWARHEEAAVGVTVHGGPSFPRALVDDPEPPAVLFHAGDPGCIAGPRAAVVGTRRCSERGRRFAEELGFALSRAGVGVVSGLARGIDGAAHRGALRAAERGGAPPIGVVASGLDVVYPHEHAELWARVAQTGVLLSEVPLGVRPNRWRFPARNRVIAGLADVLVVVESPAKGGSMYTVEEAMRRNVPVLAVPGAVGLRAGEGTNALIFDGAGVARDAADVLLELGLAEEAPAAREADSRPVPSPEGSRLLDAVAWQPVTLAGLVGRLDWSVGDVAEALTELRDAGWIAQAGAWFERIAR
jgi:DNA processing protein